MKKKSKYPINVTEQDIIDGKYTVQGVDTVQLLAKKHCITLKPASYIGPTVYVSTRTFSATLNGFPEVGNVPVILLSNDKTENIDAELKKAREKLDFKLEVSRALNDLEFKKRINNINKFTETHKPIVADPISMGSDDWIAVLVTAAIVFSMGVATGAWVW